MIDVTFTKEDTFDVSNQIDSQSISYKGYYNVNTHTHTPNNRWISKTHECNKEMSYNPSLL